jgi:hypothetical protein
MIAMKPEKLKTMQDEMRLRRDQPRKYGSKEESAKIAHALAKHPSMPYKEIAARFSRSTAAVASLARRIGMQHGYNAGEVWRKYRPSRGFSLPSGPVRHVAAKRSNQAQNEQRLIAYVQSHPEMTYGEIGRAFGIWGWQVGNLMYRRGIKRNRVAPEMKEQNKQIAEYAASHPDISYSDMSRIFGLPSTKIADLARRHGVARGKGQGPRHNSFGIGHPKTLPQRRQMSKVMSEIWASVSPEHKARLGRIMGKRWGEAERQQMAKAMRKMWREANQTD